MTTRPANRDEPYYTDTDIARLLGISLGRLRNKLTAGSPLPPRIQLPGCRNRLWPRAAVHAWLDQFLVTSPEPQRDRRRRLRRGRPVKKDAPERRS